LRIGKTGTIRRTEIIRMLTLNRSQCGIRHCFLHLMFHALVPLAAGFDVHLLNAPKPVKGIPVKKLLTVIAAAIFEILCSASKKIVTAQVFRL